MKKEQLSELLGQVDDDLLLEANRKRKQPQRKLWIPIVALAACLCLIVGLAAPALWNRPTPDNSPSGSGQSLGTEKTPIQTNANQPRVLRSPVYPTSAPYPTESFEDWDAYSAQYEAWILERYAAREAGDASDRAVNAFTEGTAPTFLMNAGTENRVYSPVNVYLALSMLAELTEGNSRAQILEILDVEDIEQLRTQAQNVWRANYSKDGALTSVLANSLWLDESLSYNDDTMALLAEEYYAASHWGHMGTDAYNELLQQWLKDNTGGLLDAQADNVELDPSCVLALASTVYYQGKWAEEFRTAQTHEDVFYSPEGEQTVAYMEMETVDIVYWGEGYTAVRKEMETGGYMWLILPDEGVSVDEVLAGNEVWSMTRNPTWENSKTATIHLKMPKFDVVSQTDLIEGFQSLGITDVFDYTVSDFSPLSEELDDLEVTQINHAARVTVDEEGCTAAAFTVMAVDAMGAWITEDEIWFTLDRPFLFVLTGLTDQPLFTGVVNQP